MIDKRVQRLIVAPTLATMALLFAFLLLGQVSADVMIHGADANLAVLQATGSFTISGKVISAADGSGIEGVNVFAWNRDKGTSAASTTTDADGAFSLILEAGYYDLTFNPPCGIGIASRSYKGVNEPSDVPPTVPLTIGYTISGTVYATSTMSAVSRTAIYAHNIKTAEGFGVTQTNELGKYCIDLEEGFYKLGFIPPPCRNLGPQTETITAPPSIITDVHLPEGFTVVGYVTGAGNLVPGVRVYAYDKDVGGFGLAPTNETGYYTGTLPSGTFDFQFIPPPRLGLGSVTITDVKSISTGCPNVTLPITLPPGFTVSGRATCNVKPVKNVFVYGDPVGDPAPSDDLDRWGLYTVDDGSYALPLVSDTYEFGFEPPEATGFNEVIITNVQVISDTILNVNFCPLFLPVVFKNYLPG